MFKTPAPNALVNQASLIDLAHLDEIKKAAISGDARTLFSADAVTKSLADPELTEQLCYLGSDHLTQFIPD